MISKARRVVRRAMLRVAPRTEYTFPLGRWGGRLGNHLFQIAGTYAIAEQSGVGVLFRNDWLYRNRFNIPPTWFGTAVSVARCRRAWPLAVSIPDEYRMHLQDVGLWGGREGEIRAFLRPSDQAISAVERRYPELGTLVSKTALHVRRGDFLSSATPHRPLPPSYFEQALEEILAGDPQTQVLVFSDEIAWCRNHLPIDEGIFIDGNPDWLDLTLMTLCEHHVCANSTFSWWGAFLSGDPRPTVPWLKGVLPEHFRGINLPHWREIEVEATD